MNKKLKVFLIIAFIIAVLGVIVFVLYNNKSEKQISNNTTNNVTNENNQNTEKILLYDGLEVEIKCGIQDISVMKITDEAVKKYNTKYYNYENGKDLGETIGAFGEETYEGVSIVSNVRKIAMTEKYNAIPRTFKLIDELPKELQDMKDYSSVNICQIDLDGDGKNENIVCYTIDYNEEQTENSEPKASSGIMLFDSNYKKIDDLVILENGFWANVKRKENKVFLSLENIEYVDIDNDKIMEMIIKLPTYEGTKLSILKYNNGNIEGTTKFMASVIP